GSGSLHTRPGRRAPAPGRRGRGGPCREPPRPRGARRGEAWAAGIVRRPGAFRYPRGPLTAAWSPPSTRNRAPSVLEQQDRIHGGYRRRPAESPLNPSDVFQIHGTNEHIRPPVPVEIGRGHHIPLITAGNGKCVGLELVEP